VQAFGTEVNGAKSWLYLGPLPGFQPSEIAKLALILALAAALHDRPIRRWLDYLRPALLIACRPRWCWPSPTSAARWCCSRSAGGMVLVRGVPWRHLLLVGLLLAVAVPGVRRPQPPPHQKARIVGFLNPGADPQGPATR
jgi:rod shape determining protein RodA